MPGIPLVVSVIISVTTVYLLLRKALYTSVMKVDTNLIVTFSLSVKQTSAANFNCDLFLIKRVIINVMFTGPCIVNIC